MTDRRIIDTHAHYDDEAFDEDRDSIIGAFEENGIDFAVNVGASVQGTHAAVRLAHRYPRIYAAVGMHPDEAADLSEADMEMLVRYSSEERVLAIGEIGLDYHNGEVPRELQKKWFIRQAEVARQVGLPVLIHSRDAAQDTMDLVKEHRMYECGGVVHCYSYGTEQAREYLDMGLFFGIGGVLTFRNARKLKEVVEYLPMDAIVLETDCPYLAPEPFRGRRNSSLYLPYVAEKIAEIKNTEVQAVLEATHANALRLYRKAGKTE